MTGPPTPPPSSALEIEDAVRSSIPPQVQSTADTPAAQASSSAAPVATSSKDIQLTSYQALFPKLAELALSPQPNIRELVQAAEVGDLSADVDHHPSRLLLTTPLVLAHLILGDLASARFALQRLPEVLASNRLSQSLFGLVAAVTEKKYEVLYARAQEITQLQAQATFGELAFGPLLAKLVETFVDAFRMKTFTLLSRAYTTIPLPLAQTYLGCSPEQVLLVAQDHHWSYDAATQVLTPLPPSFKLGGASGASPSSLSAFSTVASGLVLDVD